MALIAQPSMALAMRPTAPTINSDQNPTWICEYPPPSMFPPSILCVPMGDMLSLFDRSMTPAFGMGLRSVFDTMSDHMADTDLVANSGKPWTMGFAKDDMPFTNPTTGEVGKASVSFCVTHNGGDPNYGMQELSQAPSRIYEVDEFNSRTRNFGLTDKYRNTLRDLFSIIGGEDKKMRFFASSDVPATAKAEDTSALLTQASAIEPTMPESSLYKSNPDGSNYRSRDLPSASSVVSVGG